jgi:alpha-L-fucosidase
MKAMAKQRHISSSYAGETFMKRILCSLLALLCLQALAGTDETPAQRQARMKWWREARFGMFIHYGPVTLTGQEISWSRANSNPKCPNNGPTPVEVYDNLYKNFDPTNFNAGDWAGLAKAAGMKYVVLTAKHCDGFLLWDSKVDGYNIMATPFKRDLCAELAKAVRKDGLRVGWYFSPMDWRDPDCRSENNGRFVKKMQDELRELASNYGNIDVLWFDEDGQPAVWDPTNTYALVRGLQPQIVINNRLSLDHNPNEDYYTPEQRIGAYDDKAPWETCMTLGTQWSWKPEDNIKSAGEVVRILAQCAGGDGNLLLNVGPMPDGRVEPRQIAVLKEVGAWLAKNGESIYGTRGGPWKPTKAIASTRNGGTVYLHILRWNDAPIELPDIARKIKSASLLNGGEVKVEQQDGKLTVIVPAAGRNGNDTVVKLKLDGSAMDLPALDLPPKVEAAASNVYQNDESDYGPQNAFDGDDQSRWATDGGTKQAWIAASFEKNQTIHGVRVEEAYAGRVQKFEFQYREGDDWKTIFSGTTLGEKFEKSFEPVTAREFRLNILDATDGPTINEIEFLKK